jgi:hypothetical protein
LVLQFKRTAKVGHYSIFNLKAFNKLVHQNLNSMTLSSLGTINFHEWFMLLQLFLKGFKQFSQLQSSKSSRNFEKKSSTSLTIPSSHFSFINTRDSCSKRSFHSGQRKSVTKKNKQHRPKRNARECCVASAGSHRKLFNTHSRMHGGWLNVHDFTSSKASRGKRARRSGERWKEK